MTDRAGLPERTHDEPNERASSSRRLVATTTTTTKTTTTEARQRQNQNAQNSHPHTEHINHRCVSTITW